MLDEKEVVPEGTQTSDEDRFFSDEIIDEIDETTDEEVTEEPEETPAEPEEIEETPEPAKDKFDGKGLDEIKEMYKNLEAMMGKQAQELGELRKGKQVETATEDDGSIESVLKSDDAKLENAIKTYEEWLSTPNQAIDNSEDFGRYTIHYNKLLAEKAKREAMSSVLKHKQAEVNDAMINKFKTENNLSPEEAAKVSEYARLRLSDSGDVTAKELDVAMHALYPDKWHKSLLDKERKRIAEAKTKPTPRLAGGETKVSTPFKTPDELEKMGDDERDAYLESLSIAELEELDKITNKRG